MTEESFKAKHKSRLGIGVADTIQMFVSCTLGIGAALAVCGIICYWVWLYIIY